MLYVRVLNINTSSYLFDRILKTPMFQNMPGFIKKTLHHMDARQGSNYSSGSAYIQTHLFLTFSFQNFIYICWHCFLQKIVSYIKKLASFYAFTPSPL